MMGRQRHRKSILTFIEDEAQEGNSEVMEYNMLDHVIFPQMYLYSIFLETGFWPFLDRQISVIFHKPLKNPCRLCLQVLTTY